MVLGIYYISHYILFRTSPSREAVSFYTIFRVREDAHTLFGLLTKAEREVFRLLISVSGVGPSIARTMLSSMTPTEIQQAIAQKIVQLFNQ